jgi:dienelactone hydrolase
MATIILFHSALGLRPAVRQFAEHLESAGHRCHTPDLFDGEVFDRLEDGVAKRDALGIPELIRRAQAAAQGLPAEAFFAGFSMGAAAAQLLAATRQGARGAILMHAVLPLELLGVPAWPAAVPVQVHYAERDPWVDGSVITKLGSQIAALEVHRYPGSAHLFADHESVDFVAQSAARMSELVRQFVERARGTGGVGRA